MKINFRQIDLMSKILPLTLALILGALIGKSISSAAQIDSKISLILDAITAVTSLGTVYLGYIIYRDMGGGKKRFELVSEFLEQFRNIVFEIGALDKEGKPFTCKFSVTVEDFPDELKPWYDFEVMIAHDNYFQSLKKLFDLRNSYYMPARLKKDLTIMTGVSWTSLPPSKKGDENISPSALFQKAVVVTIQTTDAHDGGALMTMSHNRKPINLRDYLSRIKNTLDAATLWMEKHGG